MSSSQFVPVLGTLCVTAMTEGHSNFDMLSHPHAKQLAEKLLIRGTPAVTFCLILLALVTVPLW